MAVNKENVMNVLDLLQDATNSGALAKADASEIFISWIEEQKASNSSQDTCSIGSNADCDLHSSSQRFPAIPPSDLNLNTGSSNKRNSRLTSSLKHVHLASPVYHNNAMPVTSIAAPPYSMPTTPVIMTNVVHSPSFHYLEGIDTATGAHVLVQQPNFSPADPVFMSPRYQTTGRVSFHTSPTNSEYRSVSPQMKCKAKSPKKEPSLKNFFNKYFFSCKGIPKEEHVCEWSHQQEADEQLRKLSVTVSEPERARPEMPLPEVPDNGPNNPYCIYDKGDATYEDLYCCTDIGIELEDSPDIDSQSVQLRLKERITEDDTIQSSFDKTLCSDDGEQNNDSGISCG